MMNDRIVKTIPGGNGRSNEQITIGTNWEYSRVLSAGEGSAVQNGVKDGTAQFELCGRGAHDYIVGLYEQAGALSGKQIIEAVDTIAETMKQEVLSAPDTVDTSNRAVTYYVSEKNGNDQNDGLSEKTALKTLDGLRKIAAEKENVAILLERGGIYRGSWNIVPHTTIAAYGKGVKPLWVQSRRNYADPSLWVETEYPNVWRCTEELLNVGVIGFDHALSDYSDNSYHERYGLICNRVNFGFMGPQDFTRDLEFYSDFEAKGTMHEPAPLYVYSLQGNPGERFSSIEIGERRNIIMGKAHDCHIENISFKFTGAHAIGAHAENFTVRHCIFSWLGGSVLWLNPDGSATCYGNAIETGTCNGYFLENNWFYQIFDTGVTHQCSVGEGDRVQKNVRYTANLIEFCHWGIEFYNAPTKPEQYVDGKDPYFRLTENVRDRYNVVRDSGFGWGTWYKDRMHVAQAYCGAFFSANRDELTEYNIFDRCSGWLLNMHEAGEEVQSKNFYIQYEGRPLGNLRGPRNVVFDENAVENIRNHWRDKEPVVVMIPKE